MKMKKYTWFRQPNERYTIRSIEFFQPFEREHNGVVIKKGREDLMISLREAEEKKTRGQYLPAFYGHHESFENHKRLGILDNYVLVGNTAYCDVTDIAEEDFQDFKEGKYRYRSPEFLPESNTLTGLAFLESQMPYFVFPDVILEENESKAVIKEIQRFQARIKFCGGTCNMADKPYLYKDEISNNYSKTSKPIERDDTKPYLGPDDQYVVRAQESPEGKCRFQESADGAGLADLIKALTEKIDNMSSILEKLMSMEEGEAEMEPEPEPEGEPEPELKEEPEGMEPMKEKEKAKPSSVAMQKATLDELREMRKKIEHLESRSAMVGEKREVEAFCASIGADFDAVWTTIMKFSSAENRKVYLDSLKRSTPRHRVSAALEGYVSMPVNAYEKTIQKFAAMGSKEEGIARKAYQTFQDSINQRDQRNANQFRDVWTQGGKKTLEEAVERFCAAVIEDPQIRSQMLLEN